MMFWSYVIPYLLELNALFFYIYFYFLRPVQISNNKDQQERRFNKFGARCR